MEYAEWVICPVSDKYSPLIRNLVADSNYADS